ncbi:hypothetical protein CBS147326_411 [Penicillium roqueforti]|nr:hypothetical protein CBS147326_411 [Penicillium roqueforti]
MASIYQLNQPTSQFWDFVNGNLEDHPFFAPRGHRGHHGRRGPRGWDTPQQSDNTNRDAQAGETTEPNADMEKDETSASDSDSPDNNHRCDHCGNEEARADMDMALTPAPTATTALTAPRNSHRTLKHPKQSVSWPTPLKRTSKPRHRTLTLLTTTATTATGRGGKFKNKGHGGPGHHGPGPFRGMGGKGRHGHGPHAGPYDFHGYGHRPHAGPYDFHGYGHGPHAGPYEFHGYGHGHHHGAGAFGGPGRGGKGWHGHGYGHGPHAGPYGFPGPHHNGGPFGFGPRGQGHPHKGGRGRHGGPPPPFGGPFDFLRQLGAGLGFPMNAPTAEGVDFTPSVDVFDTPAKYIVHVSLPGAKKSDLSIDYDADESVLHLSGVVYRPGVNEDLHQALVMEERGQHVGVFEREIRLGTRVVPALIIVDGISAKLEDGVLNVTLPKIVHEPEVGKKKVFVEDGALENEKDAMVVDERTLTPVESEGSEVDDGETREYVKVPVQ